MLSEFFFCRRGIHTRLRALDPGIIQITHTKRDHWLDVNSDTVTCTSRAPFHKEETSQAVVLRTDSLTIRIDGQEGALTFEDSAGHLLLQEPARRPRALEETPVYLHSYENAQVEEGQSVDGARAWAAPSRTWLDRVSYECRQNFVFSPDEALYGLGSHEEGFGNLRGRSRLLYQHNMKAVVPVLISTKGWGLLFDLGCMMAFHDDEQGSYLYADCADEMNYYFFYGDGGYPALMQKYRLLTGETPMLPRYALGYIQSKERYTDAAEMLKIADEYRRLQVPLDMIVLDWQSWPENQWGYKTFDPLRFPDPGGFIRSLHEKDVRFMISIWPSMQGDKNRDRQEMLENDCMLGNRLIYNAFSPKARSLYWQQARDHLFIHGVDAWWCDCTEPFESDWKGTLRPEPGQRARLNTDEAKRYLDPARINLYSLYHSMGIYEGQRSVTAEKRVCNLTRSSFAGQHRYATITWSGDVSATWETLRRHIPEGLNFSAAGEAYWSTDIGAFFPNGNWDPWFYEGDFDLGVEDLGYRELFVRWAQYAAFLPMMRAHGTGTPREIWQFGQPGQPFFEAIRQAIHLRYRLVPYLYSLMAVTNQTGLPMLRFPALCFPGDAAMRTVENQMMLGDFLLIRPVTHPMYYLPQSTPIPQGDETVPVTLPAGFDWWELSTGKQYSGGQTILAHAPLSVTPVFARAGAILPWGQIADSTARQALTPPEIVVFPGADGSFTLYDDAGDGYGYEKGQCARIPIRWDNAACALTLGAREGAFPGMKKTLTYPIRLAGGETIPVRYTGQEITVRLSGSKGEKP